MSRSPVVPAATVVSGKPQPLSVDLTDEQRGDFSLDQAEQRLGQLRGTRAAAYLVDTLGDCIDSGPHAQDRFCTWCSAFEANNSAGVSLAHLYLPLLERPESASIRLFLRLRAARLLEQQRRWQQASAQHVAIVIHALQAGDLELYKDATCALRDVCTRINVWSALVTSLEQGLQQIPPGSEELRRATVVELAELLDEKLDQPQAAVDRLLSFRPLEFEVVEQAIVICMHRGLDSHLLRALCVLRDIGDTAQWIDASLRLARAHQRLDLPTEAIELYQAVLARDPQNRAARKALRSLYRQHKHWPALSDLLQTSLCDAADQRQRRDLALALCDALQMQEKLAEAARTLRGYCDDHPADIAAAERLVTLLARAGCRVEAARRQKRLLESSAAAAITSMRRARWHLRLALLEPEDRPQAREALQAALRAEPNDVELLCEVSDCFARWRDFREHLALEQRIATLQRSPAAAVERLIASAEQAEREGASQVALALRQLVLKRRPGDSDNLDAMLALAVDLPEERLRLLQRKMRAAGVAAQAHIRTQIGETALELDRIELAEAQFAEALAEDAKSLRATFGLMTCQRQQGRLKRASDVIVRALANAGFDSEQRGQLYACLADISEARGELAGAHEQWLQASRLSPGKLRIRIRLGLNRHKAAQYAAAFRYLRSVERHPEAAQMPLLAAEGLFIAADSAGRLKLAEQQQLLRAALSFQPDHYGALSSMCQSDKSGEAFVLLCRALERRQAPGVRVRILALLIALSERRGGVSASRRACRELLEVISGLDETQRCRLLDHAQEVKDAIALAVSRLDQQSAVRRCLAHAEEFLAACETDDALAAAHWRRAAAHHRKAGSAHEAALRCFRQALNASPADANAMQGVAELLLGQEKCAAAVAELHAFLRDRQAAIQDHPNLLDLLAKGQLALGQTEQASQTLQRRLVLQESACTRRVLAAVYQRQDRPSYAALENQRVLATELDRDTLRALTAVETDRLRLDVYYAVLSLVDGLDAEEKRRWEATRPQPRPVELAFDGVLQDQHRQALIADKWHPVSQALAVLADATVLQPLQQRPQPDLRGTERVSPVDKSVVARVFAAAARAIGVRRTTLLIAPSGSALGELHHCQPPAICVSRAMLHNCTPQQLFFWLGCALELSRSGHLLSATASPQQLAAHVEVMRAAFGSTAADRCAVDSELVARYASSVSHTTSQQLRSLIEEWPEQLDVTQWQQAIVDLAGRVGLLLCGDVTLAVDCIKQQRAELRDLSAARALERDRSLRSLVSFAASERYFELRRQLVHGSRGCHAA